MPELRIDATRPRKNGARLSRRVELLVGCSLRSRKGYSEIPDEVHGISQTRWENSDHLPHIRLRLSLNPSDWTAIVTDSVVSDSIRPVLALGYVKSV